MSQTRECATARWGLRLRKKIKKINCDSNQAKIKLKEGLSQCCKTLCKWKRRNAPLADLAEALLQGGWDFSIQDLQNRLDVFPGGVSAQIAGEETKEVCGRTGRQTDRHRRRSALITEMQVSVVGAAGRRKLGLQHQWWMRRPQHGNRAAGERRRGQSTGRGEMCA